MKVNINKKDTLVSLKVYEPNQNDMSDFEKVIKVVEDKQFSKISGVAVDLFTASFIKSVYDNVNDKNKKCMEVMSIANLISVAQTLMSKV
jgi:hypothetical protein